jgi:hypothetical protein
VEILEGRQHESPLGRHERHLDHVLPTGFGLAGFALQPSHREADRTRVCPGDHRQFAGHRRPDQAIALTAPRVVQVRVHVLRCEVHKAVVDVDGSVE